MELTTLCERLGFKSGTMINLAWQIKQQNKNYQTKEPGKIPTILFITHENTVYETVERLFALSVAKDTEDKMKNYSPKEAIELLQTKGKLALTDENNIDIYIKYETSGQDTTLVTDLIEDLEEENREVICVFHDYIKKIRSVEPAKELRHELGNVMDEFKAIAVQKQIPVITASQLNRDAARTIDASVECNKTDLARSLGVSNVGESWNLIENSDWVGIINRERQLSTDTMYLTLKRLKIRYGTDQSLDYFNHPFHDNEFQLLPDMGKEKLSKKSLSDALIGVEEDSVIKFDKKGRTSAKERKEVNKKAYSSLSDIETLFAA